MDEATSNPTREIGSSNSAHVGSLQNQESQSQGTHTTSDVWHHYTKLNWDDKPYRKGSCKYCGKQLKCTHGTSSLIRHLERCKVYPYSKFNTTQRTPRFQLTQEGAINLSPVFVPPPYDQATSRTKLARMIQYVLDPRYKLQYVKFGLELVYEKQKVQELLMRVNVSLDALFNYYLVIGGNGGIGTSRNGENALLNDEIESDKSIEEYLKGRYKRQKLVEEAEELSKSELDRYLEAKCVNQDEENFDILGWWKRNSSDYPILGLMAKDILAVQVSTVASESAFSTGGRVLDAFRSSLTPKIVESLICAQNWLRSSTHPIDIEEKFEEIEALEEELNELGLNDTTIVEP